MSNDKALSPVIGVIPMVAITVILAATIAAFVFGMAQNIQKQQSQTEITNMTPEELGYCAWNGIIIPANSTRIYNLTDGRTIIANCYTKYPEESP